VKVPAEIIGRGVDPVAAAEQPEARGGVRVLDAVALWWLFQRRGWDGTLGLVGRRLCWPVCQAAGQVRRPRLTIGRDAPTGAPLPYPDAATWKRLVSPYRS
jgi:hypothetical protein